MSDTPRTDAAKIGPREKYKYWEDFARELERELSAARAALDIECVHNGTDELRAQLVAVTAKCEANFLDAVRNGISAADAETKLAAVTKERDELRDALKPFAAHATCYGPDDATCEIQVTLGNLRRALSALAK